MSGSRASIEEAELPLLGEQFVVELANSRYRNDVEDLDFLDDPEAVRRWFRNAPSASGLAVPPGLEPASAAALRDIRDATRLLLTGMADGSSPLSEPAAEELHRASRRGPAHLALDVRAAGRPSWELHHDGPPEDAFLASVAARCILFLAGDDAGRVRRCARPACPLLFVQHHRARRFCSELCAHSVRQARYYRATKHARSGEDS
ncbi:MAG TPA: ABATE domain-containing protein [Solirubrobacteraceae bacterium]|nr:ABATE domain-containing protein [Solirubrobacteraceae bacterium]